MNTDISGKQLLKLILEKIFTSDIINSIVNILIPCIISIHCTNFKDDDKWWNFTIGMCISIIIFNLIATIVKSIKKKEQKQLSIAYNCYEEQSVINSKFATNIYRLNKTVNEYISNKEPIPKKSLDKIADFQTFAFLICGSMHTMLCNELGKDILCEITLMRKENNRIKMIAYANNDNRIPSSYNDTYDLTNTQICFVRLFNDLNGQILCIPNKKEIDTKFIKFPNSIQREDKICQYIGIPIKTNRNEIELLLQIDVSKPKVFGRNEKEMKIFAKNILYPYAMILHKSYERDLVFNQYYDMIISMLSKNP